MIRRVWRGRMALAGAVVIWSTPALFQFWLARTFDPWTQNFYRYAAGVLIMVPFLLVKSVPVIRRQRTIRRADWIGCAAAAIPNSIYQTVQPIAAVMLLPGLYTLLGRVSVIVTVLLSIAIFADERWIARSWKFQAGMVLGLLGLAGLVWVPGAAPAATRSLGIWLVIVASVSWAVQAVLIKKYTVNLGATLGSGVTSTFVTLILLVLMIAFGDPSAVLRADAWTNLVLFGSGMISIGLGYWLYYVGIREVGAALSQSAMLLCPLGAMILSAGIFGETFRMLQVISGVVLLLGAFLSLSAKLPAVDSSA